MEESASKAKEIANDPSSLKSTDNQCSHDAKGMQGLPVAGQRPSDEPVGGGEDLADIEARLRRELIEKRNSIIKFWPLYRKKMEIDLVAHELRDINAEIQVLEESVKTKLETEYQDEEFGKTVQRYTGMVALSAAASGRVAAIKKDMAALDDMKAQMLEECDHHMRILKEVSDSAQAAGKDMNQMFAGISGYRPFVTNSEEACNSTVEEKRTQMDAMDEQ